MTVPEGSKGGFVIKEKLAKHKEIQLLELEEVEKKDIQKKSEIVNQSDLVILCLPDASAKETVSLVKNPTTKIIDASTAHRIHPDWVYGFAEMSQGQKDSIQKARYVSNPGCYALGTISLLRPLRKHGILTENMHCSIFALSGYSGGGKDLIAKYKKKQLPTQAYALAQNHKHLPEITKYSLLRLSLSISSNPNIRSANLWTADASRLLYRDYLKIAIKENLSSIAKKSRNEQFVTLVRNVIAKIDDGP